MLRFLNEMTWFPTAFLGDNITWQAVDDRSTDVIFTDCSKSVTARMFFDDAGRLTDFVAQRYRENKGSFTLDTWATPMTKFGVLGGLNLPVRGQAVWRLPAGDLPYADLGAPRRSSTMERLRVSEVPAKHPSNSRYDSLSGA